MYRKYRRFPDLLPTIFAKYRSPQGFLPLPKPSAPAVQRAQGRTHSLAQPPAMLRILSLALLLAVAAACSKSGHDYLAAARASLNSSAYDDAIAAAESGLAAESDDITTWGLELVKLEAHARAGHGEQTKAQLRNLAQQYPSRLSASEYTGTAQQLQAAGQGAAAIEVLDLGAKRFPDDKLIASMIAKSASAGSDPAELEMLKSLGYIE